MGQYNGSEWFNSTHRLELLTQQYNSYHTHAGYVLQEYSFYSNNNKSFPTGAIYLYYSRRISMN